MNTIAHIACTQGFLDETINIIQAINDGFEDGFHDDLSSGFGLSPTPFIGDGRSRRVG